MTRYSILFFAIWALGCGARASKSATAYAPVQAADDGATYEEMAMEPAPEAAAEPPTAPAFDMDHQAIPVAKQEVMVMNEAPGAQQAATTPQSDIQTNKPGAPVDPMVIYSGYLKLRVKQRLAAIDQITTLVEERGGYIDSLTRTVVVVRIPGKNFEEAMTALAAIGDLLDRQVRAQDVTRQFTDLVSRRNVAKEARERLLWLLKKENNPQERLRILMQIKRLSEQIDTIESKLAAIRNLVDYFTITIDLVPILEVERVDTGLSPFAWIRELKPHLETLFEGKDDIKMTLPNGFVLFDEEDVYRAQAADTTVIRAAEVENEPKGDNQFWMDAVDFEMTSRQEKIKEKGKNDRVIYRLYENDDITPRYYLVALKVTEKDIFVIEVFYPNPDAFERHHKAVVKALDTVEVSP